MAGQVKSSSPLPPQPQTTKKTEGKKGLADHDPSRTHSIELTKLKMINVKEVDQWPSSLSRVFSDCHNFKLVLNVL